MGLNSMKKCNDLGRDNVLSLVIRLAVPSMLAQLISVLYNIVDRMFIGNIPEIGSLALAGVGVCGPIVTLLTSFGTLIGLGGSIIMAMSMGEGDNDKAKSVMSNSIMSLVVLSLTLTLIFLALRKNLIFWFGGSEITFPFANEYLTIYTLGTVFALMATGLNYFITCQGFAAVGMLTVVLGAVSNIILDTVFVFVLNKGVSGAAWATVISQFLSFLFAFIFLLNKKVPVRLCAGNYSFNIIKSILSVGISPFLIIATDSVIAIAVNVVLKHFGGSSADMLISCAAIVQSYMLLITGPLIGISGGTQAIISYNYGARSVDRIRKAEKYILGLALIFTSLMFIVTRLFPNFFVSFFTDDPSLTSITSWGIKIFTMAIIPLSFQYCLVDGLTALGKIKTALTLSMMRKSIYVICTVAIPLFFTAKYVFFAQPIADFISSAISTIVFVLVFERHLQKRAVTSDIN